LKSFGSAFFSQSSSSSSSVEGPEGGSDDSMQGGEAKRLRCRPALGGGSVGGAIDVDAAAEEEGSGDMGAGSSKRQRAPSPSPSSSSSSSSSFSSSSTGRGGGGGSWGAREGSGISPPQVHEFERQLRGVTERGKSTSYYQGHWVDEPEALEKSLARSLQPKYYDRRDDDALEAGMSRSLDQLPFGSSSASASASASSSSSSSSSSSPRPTRSKHPPQKSQVRKSMILFESIDWLFISTKRGEGKDVHTSSRH